MKVVFHDDFYQDYTSDPASTNGFDYHIDDWGGLLATEDYFSIGTLASQAARGCGAGYFAILEGGYNHEVLGHNVAALIDGFSF